MWSQVLILASRFALLRIAAFGGGADVIGPYEGHRGFTFSHSLTLPRNRAAHYAGKTNVLVDFDSRRTRCPGSKLSSEYKLYSLPTMSIEV